MAKLKKHGRCMLLGADVIAVHILRSAVPLSWTSSHHVAGNAVFAFVAGTSKATIGVSLLKTL